MKINDDMLERYLDRVMLIADRRSGDADDVRQELADHLYAKVEGMEREGIPRRSAILTTLRQNGRAVVIGYRLRDRGRWVDIRTRGVARGVIAIGPGAVGVIAIGGWSVGVVAFGGASLGVFSIAGLAIGLAAWGGLSIGALALGGAAVGVVGVGGFALGFFADGGKVVASQGLGDGWPTLKQIAAWSFRVGAFMQIILIPLCCILFSREERRISESKRWEDDLWFD